MADIKALKGRIRSVDSTLHLTRAMGLVASSKMRRANDAMQKARDYGSAFENVVALLASDPQCQKSGYMRLGEGQRVCLIAIAGDRGLAGGYNNNVFKLAQSMNAEKIIGIGKRARDRWGTGYLSCENFSSADASELSRQLCKAFKAGEFDRLCVIYTRYESMMTQTASSEWLLPLIKPEKPVASGVLFEPNERTVLESVVPNYIAGRLMAFVRESFASEVAARRMAMDSAGKNAQAMIDDLQLQYNRARQNAITQEITEIVAGSAE